jgi:predicted Zn-dependent protease
LEDDYQEIRRQLWLATDNAYKAALEQIAQKRAALRNVTRTEDIPDFSREARDSVVDETVAPPVDRRAVEALVQDLSALFRQMPDVFNSSVTWSSGDTRVRYVNSEGTTFLRRSPWISIRVTGSTQAPDGASLEDVAVYYGSRLTELPGREALRAAVREMGGRLSRLRAAPVVDQYNGPVLFEDQAAAETFNQVLASRLVAARRPVSRSGAGQSGGPGENQFMDLIGGRVLPSFMSATDDPTRVEYRGQFIGGYRVDDDGVRSRATLLIDHGILKTLLNARVPVRGITQSTGNRWGGGTVVSNLLVTVEGGLNRADLRKKLLELATQRGKEYGIVVRRFANPTASTGLDLMAMMMAMSIGGPAGGGSVLRALEAYRVYLDGREELIRNADITGITAATFKEIVAASDSSVVYTAPFSPRGAFGPTGGYAASYVVPSILFEDIAVRGPRGEIPKPPVAKHPFFETP